MIKDSLIVSVHPDHLKKRNYNIKAVMVANQIGKIVDSKYREIDKKSFPIELRERLAVSPQKAKAYIDCLLETGLLTECEDDPDNYHLEKVDNYFVALPRDLALYLFKNLSNEAVNIYCYLLNKYNAYKQGFFMERYFFSHTELLNKIGHYSRCENNMKRIRKNFKELEDHELVLYDYHAIGRPGCHGTYHELFWVADSLEREKNFSDEEARHIYFCIGYDV